MLEGVFWGAIALILYTFAGYPLLAILLARRARPPQLLDAPLPTVTLIIAAFNEASCLAWRLRHASLVDYPPDKLEILVVTDGSTDATPAIAGSFPGVRVLHEPQRRGKAAALNRAVPFARGEILVFSDANTEHDPQGLRALMRHFANPAVAAVAGEKRVRPNPRSIAAGDGAYWRFEAALKRSDSAMGSVMGAAGELFALRRDLYEPLPEDTVLDDFTLSMRLVASGRRVIYEPEALSYEEASPHLRAEWTRRVRICAGGWQAILRLRSLLAPQRGLLALQFLSRRVLRWTITPLAFPIAFFSNLALSERSPYGALLGIQALFYGLVLAGFLAQRRGFKPRWLYVPFYFAFLQICALAGTWRYWTGAQTAAWQRSERLSAAR